MKKNLAIIFAVLTVGQSVHAINKSNVLAFLASLLQVTTNVAAFNPPFILPPVSGDSFRHKEKSVILFGDDYNVTGIQYKGSIYQPQSYPVCNINSPNCRLQSLKDCVGEKFWPLEIKQFLFFLFCLDDNIVTCRCEVERDFNGKATSWYNCLDNAGRGESCKGNGCRSASSPYQPTARCYYNSEVCAPSVATECDDVSSANRILCKKMGEDDELEALPNWVFKNATTDSKPAADDKALFRAGEILRAFPDPNKSQNSKLKEKFHEFSYYLIQALREKDQRQCVHKEGTLLGKEIKDACLSNCRGCSAGI